MLLAIGVAALTLGLSFGGEWGWTSVRLLGTLGVGVVALTGALLTESRVAHPIIHLTMFRNPVFASAIASMLMSMLALFLVGFLLPFYFEELRLDTTSSTWDIVWRLGLAGLGQRLFQAPNTRALMEAAPAAEQGAASGLLATARVAGQALSVAVAGAVFLGLGGSVGTALLAFHAAGAPTSPTLEALESTFLHGFRAALTVCAGFAALGALAALVRGKEVRPPSGGGAVRYKPVASPWGILGRPQ